MINKKLKLSIVIPVYNEEAYLPDCLDSIAAQTDAPDEVIIVDNNSTDNTAAIARKYPFVTVISEKRQHQAFAQKTGFDYASGDIFGRIDGDTVLPPDWVKKVKAEFAADPNLQALDGGPDPYDVSSRSVAVAIFKTYHSLAGKIAGTKMLWGANAALRADAWRRISDKVLQRADIWEDYDLALLIGGKDSIRYIEGLEAGSSFRTAHKPLLKQLEWHLRVIRTFYLQTSLPRTAVIAACWSTLIIMYPLTLLDRFIIKSSPTLKPRQSGIADPSAISK
ncbi:MAG TPA: glycosyltransferase family 2 protein [Candidatus Saccharimonadales bacterium]|nr:glycosyltransferase family 2 protein [Candidatus Saccharimonadales bacterium]